MAFRTQQCVIARCDACGHDLENADTEGVLHFATEDEARKVARVEGWYILADRLICPTPDDQHQAELEQLMPPEPVFQIPGQLSFDGEGVE